MLFRGRAFDALCPVIPFISHKERTYPRMNLEWSRVCEACSAVIKGKASEIQKMLACVLADGHVLLDDVPGVGKTTLAVALGKLLGLAEKRIQFTPDVLPSDITGYSYYERGTGNLLFHPGAVDGAQLLLADEINRASSRTQSALLEVMEERQVTVDGRTYLMNRPFLVIATQNRVGAAGTQPLPYAQMDRFMISLSLGYPGHEAQVEMLRSRQTEDPLSELNQLMTAEKVLEHQRLAASVHMDESLLDYISRLCIRTREEPALLLGISPRGALMASRLARAWAYLQGRDYALPQDVRETLPDTAAHRLLLTAASLREGKTAKGILRDIIHSEPSVDHG